jgi:hypothetical protein
MHLNLTLKLLAPNSNVKIVNFQMNLNFSKTLRNFTTRFQRNLDMKIFPKFFKASQAFFKKI